MVGETVGKRVFSMFEMDDFLRDAGAQRVDESAAAKLGELLEDNGKLVLLRAQRLARHAGRRRVLRKDIELAARLLRVA